MAQSDARFGYRANLNRESHDLSKRFGFTCTSGQLLPIFADVATPGDSYYIQHDLSYLRTLPLLAPAMIEVKVHFESFFVPFQMMYQPIENTVFSLNNLQSSLYSMSIGDIGTLQNNDFPVLDYAGLTNDFRNTATLVNTKARLDAFRLADLLKLNPLAIVGDSNNPSPFDYSPNFFPWQLLAYQTIYQYFYRLDDKSQFNNTYCNWDVYYGTSSVSRQVALFEIHQRAWDFDYFTSAYRSPIVSDANMQRFLGSFNRDIYLSDESIVPVTQFGQATNVNEEVRMVSSGYSSAGFNVDGLRKAFNTANIRGMFANEKLGMITGRARKTYDSQVLAHFGVNVPKDVKHDLSLIGSDTFNLNVGEVTSLASTSSSALGDLAGKGWSFGNGRKHKFTAPTHGVVMTIFSVEPCKRYFGGFDRKNAVTTAFDLPVPEFDRLGNMPMYRYEVGMMLPVGEAPTDIVNWKERYYQWKRSHDQTSLAYMTGYSQLNPAYNDRRSYMLCTPPYGTNGDYRMARPDLESRYYIEESAFDNMVPLSYVSKWQTADSTETEENWNATPWLAYARDPFIVDSFEKVTKVSWMSKDGEPIYNF